MYLSMQAARMLSLSSEEFWTIRGAVKKVTTMTSKDALVADYSNESPNKILNSYSLIEAIHEMFDPTDDHDGEYLAMRVELLREVFDLGEDSSNEHARVISRLIDSWQVKPISLLPFEGALEVPDSIDFEAHVEVEKQFHSDIEEIQKKAYAIQRAYITYIVLHSIPGRLRAKTVTLGELISMGLPQTDPGQEWDNF